MGSWNIAALFKAWAFKKFPHPLHDVGKFIDAGQSAVFCIMMLEKNVDRKVP
jgi:hypothetical protein